MENAENYKIDVPEMERQRREKILESGKYLQLEIIIGKNETTPVAQMKIKNITSMEMANLLGAMEEIKKTIIQKDPFAYQIYKKFDFKSKTYEEDI